MRYRKKPVIIDAVQFLPETHGEIVRFMSGAIMAASYDDGAIIEVQTPEGTMCARHGDWIIKGIRGEFYPCKPDIFAATYEPVDEWGGA